MPAGRQPVQRGKVPEKPAPWRAQNSRARSANATFAFMTIPYLTAFLSMAPLVMFVELSLPAHPRPAYVGCSEPSTLGAGGTL